ncbi:hypothetical protein [Streptomyces sp. NPDC050504]|uniref:hypothetical protein n=1 Tax=Streptomyces sp. NPDC050504 TaxID=3365618 RepID=UPI00378F0CF3
MTLTVVRVMVVQSGVTPSLREVVMALVFVAKDPDTDERNCPTVWVDVEAEEMLFQGWKPDEARLAECLLTGPVPDGEAVVRLPLRMVDAIRKACDEAERAGVRLR